MSGPRTSITGSPGKKMLPSAIARTDPVKRNCAR